MKLTFENLGTNTYLVYEITDTDELDSMSLGMLTNNSIPGFAPASFTQMDMTKYIKYNVSAKVSVKQLFSGPVNKKRLIGVFSGVVDAMLSAEDYMLDPGSILLDMDYIFADVTTCETELVCLPIMNLDHQNQDLTMFFKNILFTTQFDQTENCDHVAQLINYLNTNPVLVFSDFKTLLTKLSSNAVSQPKAEVKPASQPEGKTNQYAEQPKVQSVPQTTTTPVAAVSPVQSNTQIPTKSVAKKEPPIVTNIPPAPQIQAKAVQATENEKPMSFFYLMQHYNKENAAIYKAQQEAAKAKKAAPTQTPAAPSKPVAKKPGPGIAVPGQEIPNVSIPGQPTAQPVVTSQPVKHQPIASQQPVTQTAVPQPVMQQTYQQQNSTPLNFGETTVLGGPIGETTVLGVAAEPNKRDPHLIRSKNNEKIPLNKPVFRIGKERSYVDYFISDNTAISRGHANIVDHNGEFFVVDTNSTNHTYVNGAMIQSGVETKLSHGDKVRLANEDFEFRMY